jgi:hypothetical protein
MKTVQSVGRTNAVSRRRKLLSHTFYFLKPIPNMDSGSLAERLLTLDNITEVHVTEGDYGFVVKVTGDPHPNPIGEYIQKQLNMKYHMALSHYRYSKSAL